MYVANSIIMVFVRILQLHLLGTKQNVHEQNAYIALTFAIKIQLGYR